MMPLSLCIGGELTIYTSDGVRTYYFRESDPSSTLQDKQKGAEDLRYGNYRKVGEKCIRGCDEEEEPAKVPSILPGKDDGEGLEETNPEKTLSLGISREKASPEEIALIKPSLDKPLVEKPLEVELSPEKTYHETVSGWRSYQDLVQWMENVFSFDWERFEKFEGKLPVPRTPEETFQLRSGIDIDTAMFIKETLNRINLSYKAQIVVVIIRPYVFNHYVCSFKKDDELYIMDYGTPYAEVSGVLGPYSSIEEYKNFYQEQNPTSREIEGISYLP